MDSHTLNDILLPIATQGPLLMIRAKPIPIKSLTTSCTGLTVYGPLYSTVGLVSKYYTIDTTITFYIIGRFTGRWWAVYVYRICHTVLCVYSNYQTVLVLLSTVSRVVLSLSEDPYFRFFYSSRYHILLYADTHS